jgi:hypothetical protein
VSGNAESERRGANKGADIARKFNWVNNWNFNVFRGNLILKNIKKQVVYMRP